MRACRRRSALHLAAAMSTLEVRIRTL